MSRFYIRLICLLYGTPLLFSGCHDEHRAKDVRDSSIGTYNYHMKQYLFDGTTLEIQAGEEDSGTFELSKTANGIELREAGVLIFAGQDCTPGLNGYYFTIPEQTLGYDNDLIIIDGFDGNTFNGAKYEGVYDEDTEQITAYFSVKIPFSTSLRVFEFVGTRQQ